MSKVKVLWSPLPGSQQLFLDNSIPEVLFSGTRGNGKSESLLMDFLQGVGQGHGIDYRGIIFRRTYPQLTDLVAKSLKWFKKFYPPAKFNQSSHTWKFPNGEELLLRYIRNLKDCEEYLGHSYPLIYWEELTNWGSIDVYETIMGCWRSDNPNIPRKYRSTTNPFGPGYSWVRNYFIDPAPVGTPIVNDQGHKRITIHGTIFENTILLDADPDYPDRLASISDPNKRKAWLFGSWDIVAGTMFADVWDRNVHVVKPFVIPETWRVDRSFDWGSSAPFAVCWWAESDGSSVEINGKWVKYPSGTLFLIAEYYGWNGKPNQGLKLTNRKIAQNIKSIEERFPFDVEPGPADPSIWSMSGSDSIAKQMSGWEKIVDDSDAAHYFYKDTRQVEGVTWLKGDNRPGTRRDRVELIRQMLEASLSTPMEYPGLFVFENCKQTIRTLPMLPIDENKPDEVDTNSEDHLFDSMAYKILSSNSGSYYKSLMDKRP